MWELEAPYLSHRQDKVHRWVLRIDPLQLHPHFKAILVLGSYLALETKIKLQCKNRHRQLSLEPSQGAAIRQWELLGPGGCGPQVMLSTKF